MEQNDLLQRAVELGANRAAAIAVKDIPFDRSFRALCESNSCGNYGRCWTCPPDAGEIDTLIAEAKQYDTAVVYQTVDELEDSYDFDGMMAAAQRHNDLAQRISCLFTEERGRGAILHLGAGGCRVCPVCAKRTQEPCRHPEQALCSLETYGVAVSELAAACGMNYINGQNTVTYFGAVFLMER